MIASMEHAGGEVHPDLALDRPGFPISHHAKAALSGIVNLNDIPFDNRP